MSSQAKNMSSHVLNMPSQTGNMSSQTGTMSSKSRNMVNQVGNMTSQVWTLLVRQRTNQIKLGKYQVKTCLYCLEEAWWLQVDGWFLIRLKISQGWSTGLLDDGGDITDSIWLWDVINICIYHCTCFYAALSPISHFYYNYACLWQTYTVIWPLYSDTVILPRNLNEVFSQLQSKALLNKFTKFEPIIKLFNKVDIESWMNKSVH